MMQPSKEEIERLLAPAENVIGRGLEHYTGARDERKRTRKISEWNTLLENEDAFEAYSSRTTWPRETWDQFGHKILFAQLIIATSEYIEGNDNEITRTFTPEAYELIREYEKFALFGDRNYTVDHIVTKIAQGDRTVIGFLKQYCQDQYYNFQTLIDRTSVERRIKLAMNLRYEAIFTKIGEAIKKYIYTHPGTWMKVFGDIEEAYREIFDSQKERLRMQDEIDRNLLARDRVEELERSLREGEREREGLLQKLTHAERGLTDREYEKQNLRQKLDLIESEKNTLARQNDTLLARWDNVFTTLDRKRSELEDRERQLENLKRQMTDENRALLDEELERVRGMERDLSRKREEYDQVKHDLQTRNNVLAERIGKIRQAMESGVGGEFVKSGEALAREMSFIGRFGTNVRSRLVQEGKKGRFRQAGIKWDTVAEMEGSAFYDLQGRGFTLDRTGSIPLDRSLTFSLERKHLLRRNDLVMLIRGGVINHLGSYLENGFDAMSVTVSEVLSFIDQTMREDGRSGGYDHEGQQYPLYALYIASPTGFDPAVYDHFSGERPGSGFLADNVVVFLQDLQDSSVPPVFNKNDAKTSYFTDMFHLGIEEEHLNSCKAGILELMKGMSNLTIKDIRGHLTHDPSVIRRALDDLVRERTLGRDVHSDLGAIYYRTTEE